MIQQNFTTVSYNLNTLIQNIDLGVIGLPDIQRPFIWEDTDVRNLFDSMYKGFPVGYLVFWENQKEEGVKTIGLDKKQKTPSLLIIDGQQRLTSLYAVIRGIKVVRSDYSKDRIYLAFNPIEEEFRVADAAIRRSKMWIPDISVLWSGGDEIVGYTNKFISILRSSQEVTPNTESKIMKSIGKLNNIQNYSFQTLELSRILTEDQAAEIFVRINSGGKKLYMHDFILTLMSVHWDRGRIDLENFSKETRIPSNEKASAFNYYLEADPEQMLRVSIGLGFKRARLKDMYNVLRGRDLRTEKYSEKKREKQFEVLKEAQSHVLHRQNWHDFLKTLKKAGYIRGDIITSENNLLYSYVFYLLGKVKYEVEHFKLRKIIARWFFTVSLTGRYTQAPETSMERDLLELREVKTSDEFITYINKNIKTLLTEDYWKITLPDELETSAARSPIISAYYASLNLLEANGLYSDVKVSELLEAGIRSEKSALERHHLFPKAYLEKIGFNQTKRNQVANYALVEYKDNIDIRDTPPKEYVRKYEKRFSKEDLNRMYHYHALPNGWENMEYEKFLNERRNLIPQIIQEGFEKLSK